VLGIARKRQRVEPPDDARELADIVLADLDGREVRLGDTWHERPAVLVFLRHYGCAFCRDHTRQLHRDRHRFDDAGVRLVLIGHGTREQGRQFLEKLNVEELELLTDEDRAAYRAAGTKQATIGELVGPRMLIRGITRSLASRTHQGPIIGNAAQLAGVIVVMPDGSIPYAHLSEDASDNPPNDEVLEAVPSAPAAA
jgi:peroxiredoxin